MRALRPSRMDQYLDANEWCCVRYNHELEYANSIVAFDR